MATLKGVQYFALLIWMLALGMAILCAWGYQQGYRINDTESMPVGIYQLHQKPVTSLRKGDIVTFCPVNSVLFRLAYQRGYLAPGECPSHFRPLIKPVAAIHGDTVQVNSAGVWVNNQWIPNSAPLTQDSQGRRMSEYKAGVYSVKTGAIWVISSHSAKSFDSRYFGPVSIQQVQGVDTPWFIWQ